MAPNDLIDDTRRAEVGRAAVRWPSWRLTPRQVCDLELLLNGAFAPLDGFMRRHDYERVRDEMRLSDGAVWPIPVVLDVPAEFARGLSSRQELALRDDEGTLLAAMRIDDIWRADRTLEAERVYGTTGRDHPGVAHLLDSTHEWYIGGAVEGIQLPVHHDFPDLRLTPAGLRAEFARLGCERVVAFQTRNPLHRAHVEMTRRAAEESGAHLLLHPSVGITKPGDVDHYTRVRCYRAVMPRYAPGSATLALLPLAMRMGGPREALWHARIRRNFGCTHFIVGRDHAGPGRNAAGRPFYDPYAAQDLVKRHEAELGITMVPFREMVYVEELGKYLPEDEVPPGTHVRGISGTELRDRLAGGREIPSWFTYPEVSRELTGHDSTRPRPGFTVFFTGLSASGKSSIANALTTRILERTGRPVTLLDGDVVRTHLSSELGFSKEHRDLNIRRIAFVAREVARHGGIAVCAAIAPFAAARADARTMIDTVGGFVLVHVSTPVDVCETRDRKGLYAKARAGVVAQFTGVSDPYESPTDADVTIDTTHVAPDEAVERIVHHLVSLGYLEES